MEKLLERFLSYVKVDTESDPYSTTFPSTEKQYDLARMLVAEMKEMGLTEVELDEEYGYVYGTLPSNLPEEETAKTPVLGFIAHMDTSPDASGSNVKPQIIVNYDGNKTITAHASYSAVIEYGFAENDKKVYPTNKKAIATT